MIVKLAFRNVRRSIRDYAIYFLTLTLGVCIFYVFNSFDSQQAVLNMTKSQANALQGLSSILGMLSGFISVILGFLILYANRFLVRRRKLELGVYTTLGMNRSAIAGVLTLETVFIGVLSLAAGLFLGVFLAQGVALLTAKLFTIQLKTFQIVFSTEALWKTIVYFGIIFLMVIAFHSLSISKYKLIDLLNANRRNESLKGRRLWISVILFLLSAVSLGAAYYLIIENGMMTVDASFWGAILLGIVGTFLFFRSLSGFLLRVVQSNKRLYLKNLNMFVLRQINSKINTNYVSMTVICLMLLVSIGALAAGMGLGNTMAREIAKTTAYDASVTIPFDRLGIEDTNDSILDTLAKDGVNLDSFSREYHETSFYTSDITFEPMVCGKKELFTNQYTYDNLVENNISLLPVSDFNAMLAMQGKTPVTLSEDQFLLNSTTVDANEAFDQFLQQDGSVTLGGITLKAAQDHVDTTNLITSANLFSMEYLVVPDQVARQFPKESVTLNINYKEPDEQSEALFWQTMEKVWPPEEYDNVLSTRKNIEETSAGVRGTLSYLAIYVGLIFLIACAAVLALQQLSEASDNIERYRLLRKLGVENKMINHALLLQVGIYFLMPLVLAVLHSMVGIGVINGVVSQFGTNMLSDAVITSGIVLFLYGLYFLATYFGSKNMIRERKR